MQVPRACNRLCTIVDIQLIMNIVQVNLDRSGAHYDMLGDCAIGESRRYQVQDLDLALA